MRRLALILGALALTAGACGDDFNVRRLFGNLGGDWLDFDGRDRRELGRLNW